MKLEHIDFTTDQLDKMQERQRLGNVLAICQCLLLIALIGVLVVKL